MPVRRIMPYHESPDFEATRAFYTGVLGLEEGSFGGGYIGFGRAHRQGVDASAAGSVASRARCRLEVASASGIVLSVLAH